MRYVLYLVFLLNCTLAQAQSSETALPAPRELYEGILALACVDNDPNGEPPETLIITETNGEFQIVNAPRSTLLQKLKTDLLSKARPTRNFWAS